MQSYSTRRRKSISDAEAAVGRALPDYFDYATSAGLTLDQMCADLRRSKPTVSYWLDLYGYEYYCGWRKRTAKQVA